MHNQARPSNAPRSRPTAVIKQETSSHGRAAALEEFSSSSSATLQLTSTMRMPQTQICANQRTHQDQTDDGRWKEDLANLVRNQVLSQEDEDQCYRVLKSHELELSERMHDLLWDLEANIGTPGEPEARREYVRKLSDIRRRHVDDLNRILIGSSTTESAES